MTTAASSPSITIPRWPVVAHTTGAALIGAIGLAHLLFIHVFGGEDGPDEELINDLSARTPSPMFENGRQITVFDLNTGYSVGMGMLGVMFAILVLVAARNAPHLIARWSPFNWACTATAVFTCWIAVLYFPEPVIAFSVVGTLCFAAVLFGGTRSADYSSNAR
ncbi:LIC_13387 family protein [Nocardia mexicana]|uniref:Uncharacterized protein n=1 Tax=Nocardia mexicana TaxID=279262 RepID=A0A370GFR8_9NOCA|nr:hypothetical protein [Nocardia mexicana]RDI42150.1 hypothetical protein DFR68_12842 [Nocardia mexicana]